ncbi:hypothetical protein [Chitinophaga costaii]|nr:hypothetical protein [Chitinophaga costaii]
MRLSQLLLATGLLFSTVSFAQSQGSFTESRTADGVKVLKGKVPLQTLMNDSAFRWFYTGVNKYQPGSSAAVDFIKSKRTKFNVVAIGGTWDPASQDALPKLVKILILASYSTETIDIYGVDQKNDAGVNVPFKFKRIPTFIITREGKEVGRINGNPEGSNIETELSQILLKATKNDKPDPAPEQ